MIKRYYDITLRDYNKMETTGSINQFATTILPAFLFKKRLIKEIEQLGKLLNAENDEQEFEKWKLLSLAKINAMEINYLGMVNILELNIKINGYKKELRRKARRKIHIKNDNLKTYIDNIKSLTGISVVEYADIEKVRQKIEFKKDKFNENFNKKPAKKEYLLSIAIGVFSYLEQPINMDMRIVEFALLRDSALMKMSKDKTK